MLAKCSINTLKVVATPGIDDHHISSEKFETKGILSDVCSRIVLKVLFFARVARPDLLSSVNMLAREVTKWTAACDDRLLRLISYINCTKHWVLKCHVGDDPSCLRLACYADASFAGDLRDSKSTSGCIVCLVGPNTFIPLSWFCKKQTAVSHSSTEAEIISLEAVVRMEGLPLLNLLESDDVCATS